MALYDSADLLAKTRAALKLPSLDQPAIDTLLYQALSEAQVHWLAKLAAYAPELNYGEPEQLTTSDGGYTYDLVSEPLGGHLELRATRSGQLLLPSTDWGDGDYVFEGQKIRIPGGRQRTFAGGPWARYVKAPGDLTAAIEPTIKPTFIRLLLVYRAAGIFARNSQGRDPEPYWEQEKHYWSGNPRDPQDPGFLGTLKTQQFAGGAAATGYSDYWWRNNPDLG